MTTGYTHCVEEGATFAEFLWHCAGAFHRRLGEQPRDRPLGPKLFNGSSIDYARGRLKEAQKHLEELNADIPDDAKEYAAELDHLTRLREWADRNVQRRKVLRNYELMREAVHAWEAPGEGYSGLKRFMLTQIDESVRLMDKDHPRPEAVDADDLHSAMIKGAEKDIKYYTERVAEEEKAYQRNLDWVIDLNKSVPYPHGITILDTTE